MKLKSQILNIAIGSWLAVSLIVVFSQLGFANGRKAVITGCVLDSSCLFRKHLHTKISVQCAKACAQLGSPLVILAPEGTVYWPIDKVTPAHGQNPLLIKFAGQNVKITGIVYEQGGSKAIILEKITPLNKLSK